MEQGITKGMYKKHILELYKNPSNFGVLENATSSATGYNSFCGDEITVQLAIKDGIVRDAKFSGSGCVLSLVSASMLTDNIKGMKISDIKKMDEKEIKKLFKTKISSSRSKCVLLPLEAVKKALE